MKNSTLTKWTYTVLIACTLLVSCKIKVFKTKQLSSGNNGSQVYNLALDSIKKIIVHKNSHSVCVNKLNTNYIPLQCSVINKSFNYLQTYSFVNKVKENEMQVINSRKQKLYTGCVGFVYNTHKVRWATKKFETFFAWRKNMPKSTPIPTHVFSVIAKDGELFAAEAVFEGYRICPLNKYYAANDIVFYEPTQKFTQPEQEAFEQKIFDIAKNTKGYDVKGYLAQSLYILFNIKLDVGKGTQYVYCNEAHEYAFNAARPETFSHPWNDNPLELQESSYLKKLEI